MSETGIELEPDTLPAADPEASLAFVLVMSLAGLVVLLAQAGWLA